MASTEKRLIKEYKAIQKDLKSNDSSARSSGILQLRPKVDDLFKWVSLIQGPSSTPFENCIWELEIDVPLNYPLGPPMIRFRTFNDEQIKKLQTKTKSVPSNKTTNSIAIAKENSKWIKKCYKMPHPNINFKNGEICLDILQKRWSPAWTLQSSLIAVIVLLSNPEPLSPLNIDLANLLKCEDNEAYNDMINYYIGKYSCWELQEDI